MAQPSQSPTWSVLGSLVLIAVVLAGGAAAFTYTAGWFSPQRLTPDKLADALAPPTGVALGHRRNHAKGICFISFWPYMIPFSITIEEAAVPHSSLAFMFWGKGIIVFPLML